MPPSKAKFQIGFGDIYPAPNLRKYFNQIVKTRRFSYGPITQKLESKFSELVGIKHSVFCSSGTAALFTAIGVLKNLYPELAKERKLIVMPAVNFISDVNVTVFNGFTPAFIDVSGNYNLDYDALETFLKLHGREVFAVIGVSLMGRPVNGQRIRELIDSYTDNKGFFILDSCENLASRYGLTPPEEFAHFSCWSTYLSHLLVGGACGGFIGTNNAKYAIYARSFINHGRDAGYLSIDADNNVNEATLKDITAKRFSFVQHGMNFRMDELNAAVALSMLEDNFEAQLSKRKQNAEKLIKALSAFPLILPSFSEEEQARHMMLPILFRWDKDALVNHLETNGVETRPILPVYQPITEKYFGKFDEFQKNFPKAALIYTNGFYIGCHSYLTDEQIQYIVSVFADYFKK